MAAKKASKAKARPKAGAWRIAAAAVTPTASGGAHTLEALLISGPIARKFAEKNPVAEVLGGDEGGV